MTMINKSNYDYEHIKKLYRSICDKVIISERNEFNPDIIGACDVSYRKKAIVSCILWNNRNNTIEEEMTEEMSIPEEYIPGRFSLRELPLILKIIPHMGTLPDCIILDGHGIAHPERAGLATFAGVLLKVPSIGCAKSPLVGEFERVPRVKGEFSDIIHKGEKVGEVLCTKNDTNPIFVSPGHLIGFKKTREIVLSLVINSKYPEPLRLADINTRKRKN